MPKVIIYFRIPIAQETFPNVEESLDAFADEILDFVVTPIILAQMKDRTSKPWQPTDMKMEWHPMPRGRNRKAVEVEVFTTYGPHWQGIEVDTQEKLNDELLNLLIRYSLTAKGWDGSAWLQTVGGSYGETDQAALRTTARMQSQRP